MDTDLSLQVTFSDDFKHTITVHSFDCPQILTTFYPVHRDPVAFLHNDRCLCPFLSFAAQGVATGDTILLHPMKPVVGVRTRSYRRFPQLCLSAMSSQSSEALRLADLSFAPYESSSYGGRLMSRMGVPQEKEKEKDEQPMVVQERTEAISESEMPICWVEGRKLQPQPVEKKTESVADSLKS
jgi:hypothetical protein